MTSNPIVDLLIRHLRDLRDDIAAASAKADDLEQRIERLNAMPAAVPQHRSGLDGWSPEEDAILREHYPTIGAPGCQALMPHRSQLAIRTRASKKHLGVQRLGSAGKKTWCAQCERRVSIAEAETCSSEFCKADAKAEAA